MRLFDDKVLELEKKLCPAVDTPLSVRRDPVGVNGGVGNGYSGYLPKRVALPKQFADPGFTLAQPIWFERDLRF